MPSAAIQPGTAEATPRLDEAIARLRSTGHRVTEPRIAMLNALLRLQAPASMEQIHSTIAGACDLVTVYRSIGAMVEIGLVRRLFAKNGTALHELALEPERYHVVTRSGEVLSPVEAVPSPEMRLAVQAVEDALRARGYAGVRHVIQFFADAPTVKSK